MRFDWDPAKARSNLAKHGVSFEQARSLFEPARDILEVYDENNSQDEDRFVAIGWADVGLLVVAYTERDPESIRIISARKASKVERRRFEEYQRGEL